MQCAACGTENDAGSKFCMTCGAPQETASGADATPPPSGEHEAASIPSHDLTAPSDSDPSDGDAAKTPAPAGMAAPGTDDASPPPAPADSTPPPGASDASASSGFPPPPPTAAPPASGGFAPPSSPPAPGNYPPAPTTPPPGQSPAGGPPAPGAYPPPAAEQAWGQAVAPAPAWGSPSPGAPAPGGQPPAWGQQGQGGPPGPGYGAPAGQGYPPPAGPGFQQQAPAAPAGPPDPNGLGASAGRLGNRPRKDARSAFAVAGAVLEDGELVEAVSAGKFEGNAALLVLTDRALILVDDRPWKPTVERITIDGGLQVQGWQDDRSASLTLITANRQMVLESIADKPLAVEMAQRIRYRTGS